MDNVALKKWSGPGGGVPAFDRVRPEHLREAFDEAMTIGRGEIAAIANAPETPTFDNVFAALEGSGVAMSRVMAYYGVWRSTMKTDEVRRIELEIEPRLAAYHDEFVQNERLFAKIEAVANDPVPRRDVRERAYRAWTARGATTNPPRVREILALRTERARRFGFETHAHWHLADKMITDPRRTLALMNEVWAPAVARARRDIAEMQELVDAEGAGLEIEPWDHRYYAELRRRAKFDLDPNAIRPYMRFENVRDAMFAVATKLYELSFAPIDVPVIHPDVRAYAVYDASVMIGVFYLDPFARPGKSSGAWMSHYRSQARLGPVRRLPIVSNNSNFVRASGDHPTELSWDDARTMFHEFGHALHGLLSDVRFPYLQGTQVATDYVEFPSHFHENFLGTDEVLGRLTNAEGHAPPAALIDKIRRAQTFNAGFATVEFLANAILDMRLHLAGAVDDPAAFAEDLFREIGLPREIAPRHGLFHFSHAFSGDHYSAGYYSYLWSDVMASDAFAAFVETGDAFDPAVAKRLRDHVLARGNTLEPSAGYRAFRGRDPVVASLLRARGLTPENP